jgi:hypothetical protein
MFHSYLLKIFSVAMFDSCYHLEPIQEVYQKVEAVYGSFYVPSELGDQLPFREVTLVAMPEGRQVLLPTMDPDRPDELVLVFDDYACFEYYYDQDRFPLKNDDSDYFANHTPESFKLDGGNVNYYKEYLERRLGVLIPEVNLETLKDVYLLALTLDFDEVADINDVIFAVSMLFGEVMRQELNGKWLLMKSYGNYNPYYTPCIISQEKVFLFMDFFWNMMSTKFSSFETVVNMFRKIGGGILYDIPEGCIIIDSK